MCIKVVSKSNQLVLGKDRAFTFDYVLPSKCSQEEVYEKCVDNLVSSCFDGYNATVFAYGQTVRNHQLVKIFYFELFYFIYGFFQGSGKTHTVGGDSIASQTEDEFGIIPRAVKHLYEIIKVSFIYDHLALNICSPIIPMS